LVNRGGSPGGGWVVKRGRASRLQGGSAKKGDDLFYPGGIESKSNGARLEKKMRDTKSLQERKEKKEITKGHLMAHAHLRIRTKVKKSNKTLEHEPAASPSHLSVKNEYRR